MRPYQLVREQNNIWQVVSNPFIDQDKDEWIAVQIPGNLITLTFRKTSNLRELKAKCKGIVFEPSVSGNSTNAHIDCPVYGRRHYVIYEKGIYKNQFQDLELTDIP